jgi:hypothetical protein
VLNFTCNVPGCLSRCQLAYDNKGHIDTALAERGWTTVRHPDAANAHFCPFHTLLAKQPKPSDKEKSET